MGKQVKLYACGVDWQHEIGEASDINGNIPLYYSIEKLKKERPCTKQCGVVEVNLSLSKWVECQDFSELEKNEL